jgi:hypothetical protein
MIHLIRDKVTPEQLHEMLEQYPVEQYIKLAVDVEEGIAVGGGEMHYECEEVLLDKGGSIQRNIWGAGWFGRLRKFGTTPTLTFDRPTTAATRFKTQLRAKKLER